MIDEVNKPEDWGVASKDEWVADKPLSGEVAMPALEGRDVVGFSESIDFAIKLAPGKPAGVQQWTDEGGRPVRFNPATKSWYHIDQSGKKDLQKKLDTQGQQDRRPEPKSEEKPRSKPAPEQKEEPKPSVKQLASKPSVPPKKPEEKNDQEARDSSKILNQANSQRQSFLKKRGRNPEMYIDVAKADRGKSRTSVRNYIERKFSDNPKLRDASVQVLEFMSLWVDGDGKRISGDTIKEGKTAQDVKQFSLEYQFNNDGSISQIDPSEEGEQRAFRNFDELNSILEGPIKKALLAAGLTEEDLSEHPPQKPNLKGLSKEDKDIAKKNYEQKLSKYNEREARRNSIAESLPQEVMQEHLQLAERKKFGSPLDSFKDLSPEEQDAVVDAIYPLLPPTLKGRFDKVGSPRKNIFGGYRIENGKRVPVYADKITSERGKGMLKKYLVQGGIDGYSHSSTIMSPYSLTLDHVLPSAKGGGDHPDNGVFTRGGLNTHLSDNSFLWLYRSALGEKERLNQLSENPEEQKQIYNEAQKAAYRSQFGASVALSQAGTGKKLSISALSNSRGNLTGNMREDINLISQNLTDNDLADAGASSIDTKSKEVQEFIKKQTLKLLGISYFGTSHPNAAELSEKGMSSSMQNMLWSGISSRLRDGSSLEEINDSISDIKNTLAASLLSGTKAGERYLSKIDTDQNSDIETIFNNGINKLSKFLGRNISQNEINMIRSQL